jgi:hypothetical protein
LGNQRYYHWLDAKEQASHLRHRAKFQIGRGERCDEKRRRQDKARSRDNQSRQTGSNFSKIDRQLRRTRSWQQTHRAHQIEKSLLGQPPAPADEFFLHHGDVGRGPAISNESETQEFLRHLEEFSAPLSI